MLNDDDVLSALRDQKDVGPQGGPGDVLREFELCFRMHFKLPFLGNCQDPQCPLFLSCSGLLSCLDESNRAGGVAHIAVLIPLLMASPIDFSTLLWLQMYQPYLSQTHVVWSWWSGPACTRGRSHMH